MTLHSVRNSADFLAGHEGQFQHLSITSESKHDMYASGWRTRLSCFPKHCRLFHVCVEILPSF